MVVSSGTNVRRAELLAVLSLGADLGLGQPMEHVLRECLIAMRLGERIGLNETERVTVYYAALLTWVGCHVDAYEQAKWFGDDLAFKSDFPLVDHPGTGFVLKHLGAGRPFLDRARLGVTFLGDGRRDADSILDNHRMAAEELAAQLGLGQDVRNSLGQAFERWDGKGTPGEVSGEDISVASRLVSLADVVEVFHRAGGVPAAISVARERSGTQFDPALVDAFCRDAAELFGDIESATTWDAVIAAEPDLEVVLTDEELDAALAAMANFADLKSPYTLGHSCAVAELAGAAARVAGAPRRRCGAGSPRRVRARPGPARRVERDLGQARRAHAGGARAGAPAPVPHRAHAGLVGGPRSARRRRRPAPRAARRLGLPAWGIGRVADTDGEDPGRGRHVPGQARTAAAPPRARRPRRRPRTCAPRSRRAGSTATRSTRCSVAAGHPVRRRRAWPAGLTSREVEVLRLAALGLSNREIADRLVISRKTAANHVEHIYAKIGVSNRARASLFAVRNGLIPDTQPADEV